eukprot:scaffold112_cov282-Prasinococcus_capsulatus_cf.AAC.15
MDEYISVILCCALLKYLPLPLWEVEIPALPHTGLVRDLALYRPSPLCESKRCALVMHRVTAGY